MASSPHRSRVIRWLPLAVVLLLIGGGVFFAQRKTPASVGADRQTSALAPQPGRASDPAAAADQTTAPKPAGRALFAFAPAPANAAAIEARSAAPTQRIHYVSLNQTLLAGKRSPFWRTGGQGRVDVPLPDGRVLPVVIEHSTLSGPDRYTSVGHLDGMPGSRAIFAYNAGVLQAMIEDNNLNRYTLRSAEGGVTQFFQVDPAQLPGCGGSLAPVLDSDALMALAAAKAAKASAIPQTQGAKAGDVLATAPATGALAGAAGVEVRVLMAYTSAARQAAGGTPAAQAMMDLAIATMNSDLQRSNAAVRMKLIGTTETTLTGDGDDTNTGNPPPAPQANWISTALTALRKTADGSMDEIHALRDQLGADLVCLAVNRQDATTTIGIAYILNTPNDATNPLFAFAVVGYSYIASSHVVSHELGHTLGCAHARGDSGTTGTNDGAYSYSYGYRFTGQNGTQYRTIMAYSPGTTVAYYSNPDVTASEPAINVPLGIPVGQTGETDNALTIDRNAFEVANYRALAAPTYTGTLVNVSTRAFVGTGDQTLIAGFVVTGTAPRKMLVRAVGPGLVAQGVTGALGDPVLTLYRRGTDGAPNTIVGTNDNWGTQVAPTTASDLVAAATQTGAFALASGSRDAAMLVTLDPGLYTVNIYGTNGTTGIGLVEAYDDEVGSVSTTRVVNLSTRGYADSSKLMIAGFVVAGDATQTKRILVRALGPSLADQGVSGVMADPIIALYDANSNLLMKNDDWDPPTTTVDSEVLTTRGTVDTVREQQIQATGFAPPKPVEPAILLDLKPGVYSVILQPFESLPDQPAEPGVAIVEVYEISGP